MPDSSPAISLKNVSKQYGSFEAVQDLNLEIYRGELFSLLGLNGAGKTSTIKMLTGLSQANSGTIKIAGFDIAEEANKAKSVLGYVPDRGYFFEKLKVIELLAFCGQLYDLDKTEILDQADLLLNEFHLNEWRNELIENLSHGMRQRLSFCAALIHQPQILVIDEPMVGLDPYGAKALKKSLLNFTHRGGTVFLSTHSLPVAEELSNRIGIIHHGQLIAYGTLEEISQNSSNTLEEIFLGLTIETPC